MRKLAAFVAMGCAVLVAACGSSHKSTSPTTTVTPTVGSVATTTTTPTTPPAGPTTPAAPTSSTTPPAPPTTPVGDGARYLAIVSPLTDALESAPANPTPAQLDLFAAEVRSAQAQLSAFRWPGHAETDIRTLVDEMGPLAADLARGDAGAVSSTVGALTSASVTIRADLGLPSTSR